ncbi:MAG: hypothetical protein N4A48_09265 [Tepidibacter sp.]|nr:hypothetical protein [Tepidibacter sp.]MCT4508935.1 hypothetical protein [Tepidibacter sp.]
MKKHSPLFFGIRIKYINYSLNAKKVEKYTKKYRNKNGMNLA